MKQKIYDLLIIGAGVSCCFGLLHLKSNINTLVLEKNNEILKKFMITGKGKSNIANNSDVNIFLSNLIESNKFLYPCLTKYNGNNILKILDKYKLSYYEKEPHRYHLNDSNSKFRNIILNHINENQNINLKLNTNVIDIEKKNDVFHVITTSEKFLSKNVIVATGGLSFKNLGASDFAYKIAKKFNHQLSKIYPIGVGLYLDELKIKQLQGISLDNVNIKVYWDKRIKYQETGPLMFTHYGIGGPVVRRVSGYVSKYLLDHHECIIEICFINQDIVEKELSKYKNLNQCFKNYNKTVINYLLNKYGNLDLNNISKKTKQEIINCLSNHQYVIKQTDTIDVAINTGGGIDLKKINPNNLESKIIKNLFFVGEALDLNPRTNGYNITTCFTTVMNCIDYLNKQL